MPEIGTATIKVVPDTSGFTEALEQVGASTHSAVNSFYAVLTLLLLVCSPAIVWAVYGWAF